MIYSKETDDLIFESTGKREYCHDGYISISPDGSCIGYGTDGGWRREDFTDQEQLELADQMIAMWTRFKESI